MRALTLVTLFAAAGALAAGTNPNGEPRARCAACSLLPAGATGSDLTLSGMMTAGGVNVTGTTVPANGIYSRAASTITFAAATTGQWEMNSAGEFYPLAHQSIADSSTRVGNLFMQGTLDTTGNVTMSSTTGTAGSGTGITVNATSLVRPFVHKVTVINTALTAAASTDLTIWTTPVNTRLIRIVAEVTQVFTGGALSAVTVQCGSAAGGTQYLLANSVFTATNTWGDAAAEIGAGLLSATVADMGTPASGVPGAIAISCRFTCTGANCNAATQGSVSFEIEGVTYP